MFDDVVGQPQAVAALKSHLARTGGAGSTLIVGPEGVGRFLLALCAARAILGDAVRSDLFVLDPEAGIDGVRSARERLARKPMEGPRQVLILRDVDRFSRDAQNALLKTLEEPPADAALFLVAEGPEFLPETVVSRCRTVRARPLTDEQCAQVTGAGALATDAEGSPGRAAYQAEAGIAQAADGLLEAMSGTRGDPVADVEKLARRKPGEESKLHRRRMTETLRVLATRLRRDLPESSNALHSVVSALGSLGAHANPTIVFSDLALIPWKKKPAKTRPGS